MPKPLDRRIRNREYDAARRQRHEYRAWYNTTRWRRVRAAQLAAKPLCERCEARGKITPATVCHHLIAHKGDEAIFWSGPFGSSCADCHDVDEQRIERGGKARQDVGADGWPIERQPAVARIPPSIIRPSNLRPSRPALTIVCGAPGSGKSTYVRTKAQQGAVVIDLDDIIDEISGNIGRVPAREAWLRQGLEARNARLAALSTSNAATAWFVIGAPDAEDRHRWAQMLGAASVVVMSTPLAECLRRIDADPSRAGLRQALGGQAMRWWRRYRARRGELLALPTP